MNKYLLCESILVCVLSKLYLLRKLCVDSQYLLFKLSLAVLAAWQCSFFLIRCVINISNQYFYSYGFHKYSYVTPLNLVSESIMPEKNYGNCGLMILIKENSKRIFLYKMNCSVFPSLTPRHPFSGNRQCRYL